MQRPIIMNRNTGEYLPAILNVLAASGVLLLSFLVRLGFPISREAARTLGMLTVAGGMALVVWAAVHIREAFLGRVHPRLGELIQSGPYRFARHPVYLGMTIALAGVAISLRSWPGLIGVFLLFLPSEVYRARLEEKALLREFGARWKDYAHRTGFMLPRIGRD